MEGKKSVARSEFYVGVEGGCSAASSVCQSRASSRSAAPNVFETSQRRVATPWERPAYASSAQDDALGSLQNRCTVKKNNRRLHPVVASEAGKLES